MSGLLLRGAIAVAIAVGIFAGVRAITATPDGLRISAEFTNAHGLVVGNDVRISGAPAGRVNDIALTDHGTALVSMRLNDGLAPPRTDATAAVRPVDLLDDTYVALDPGVAGPLLRGPIPASRTLNDPRLDDLLRVFRSPQRAGMKAILVELGIALDQRGGDLNRAALGLRSTLAAADRLMRELGSQNADLGVFVRDAERIVAQAAARRADLGVLVNAFAAVLRTTSEHAGGLDAGLATMPETLAQARRTVRRLARTAVAARPLSAALARSANDLSTAGGRLRPFLAVARTAAQDLRPTLRRATNVLTGAAPTLASLRSGLDGLRSASPDLASLTGVLAPAAPDISEGFFVNFPDQASEPGTQPFDPFADPRRNYWRGAGVMSCQAFGLPIEPGCLSKFLAASAPARRTPRATRPRTHRTRRLAARATSTAVPAPPVQRVLDYLLGP